MERKTREKIAKLQRLTDEGNGNIYRRIKLAAELLDDPEYLAEMHANDWVEAVEAVESKYFAMLGGDPPLRKLIKVYEEFPREAQWKEYRYNLRAMVIAYEDAERERNAEADEESPRAKPMRVTRAMLAEAEEERDDYRAQLKFTRENLESSQERIERLERELQATRTENARLQGRIEELESILNRQRAPSAA